MPEWQLPSIFRHMTPPMAAETAIDLVVNGQRRTIRVPATLADLLAGLELDARVVVVEHNGEIVRDRSSLATRSLGAGDVLEIVHFVGGG